MYVLPDQSSWMVFSSVAWAPGVGICLAICVSHVPSNRWYDLMVEKFPFPNYTVSFPIPVREVGILNSRSGTGTCRWNYTTGNAEIWLCLCMRGIQKVRRLTQLATRYARHILSLFNIVTCNWNALGPAFLQSYDSDIEELLFFVFQPAICHAIRIRMPNTVGDGVIQSRHFRWQPVLELTCD